MAEWSLIEARPDWLTATATDPTRAHHLLMAGLDIIQRDEEAGNDRRPRSWMGYRGTGTEHCFVGWRPDGACCRVSAVRAGLHWRTIADVAQRPTRVDVCLTAQGPSGSAGYAAGASVQVREHQAGRGRPAVSAYLESSVGGATLYCGRRASGRFGRLYRKDIESPKDYDPFSWRWEVEYKADLAGAVLAQLLPAADVSAKCAALVAGEFARWGAPLPGGLDLVPGALPRAGRPPTDAESRMAWLASSVRSAVGKAARTHPAVNIMEALGIQGMDDSDVLDLTRLD